jgi:hypothetical protein
MASHGKNIKLFLIIKRYFHDLKREKRRSSGFSGAFFPHPGGVRE